MTKAIASYPQEKQGQVISSRLSKNTGGLGYLAAVDADYRRRIEAARKQILVKEAEKPS